MKRNVKKKLMNKGDITQNDHKKKTRMRCGKKHEQTKQLNKNVTRRSYKWNNCHIKNNQEILLDLADFSVLETSEDNSMVSFS